MDFNFTEEQSMMKDMVKRMVDEKIAPAAVDNDKSGAVAKESAELLAKNGMMGIKIPDKYGGQGLDYVTFNMVIEEISKGDVSTSAILFVHNLGLYGILKYGNEDQRKKYLPDLARGTKIAAFGLTEPESGSDTAQTKTMASPDEGGFLLNGIKHFISNAEVAEVYTVYAVTDKSAGLKGLSCFVVEKGTKGFTFGKHEDKMGLRGSTAGELIFDNCRIPKDNLVGNLGSGYKIAMEAIFASRPSVGAQGVGLAQSSLEKAIAYAKVRIQYGSPIIQHQLIRCMLADMHTEICASRLLVFDASRAIDEGKKDWRMKAAVAKIFATEMSHRIVHKALQIHGGYGYMKDYPIERYYRDQRVLEIYEGTNEMNRLFIAGQLAR
jgi:alkylation response protein AidB-like acyl-CoA dehydrogenase